MQSAARKNKNLILLTGGGGYIGSILAEELVSKGYAVRVFDAFYWGKEVLKHLKDKIELVEGDIRTIDAQVLKGVKAVIHQAGFSNDPMAEFNPKVNHETNTKATIRLAKLCKYLGIERFSFSSSASIYDKNLQKNDILQNEKAKVVPKAAYSISKIKAERGLLKLADNNFCPVILRQGTVYGFSTRMRYDLVVNSMIKTALMENKIKVFCSGKQWRPLVDIQDVAKAHILAIEAKESRVCGQIFNVVYKNYRMLKLAQSVKITLNKVSKINPEIEVDNLIKGYRSYRISGKKIRKTLGWQPNISLEKSIKNMVKKIKKYRYTDFLNPRYYNIEWMKRIVDKI